MMMFVLSSLLLVLLLLQRLAAFHLQPQLQQSSQRRSRVSVLQWRQPQHRLCRATATTLNVETSSSSSTSTTDASAVVAETPPSNIIKRIITPGSGATLKRGDIATVSYSLYVPSSQEDSSISSAVSRAKQQKVVRQQ